VQIFGGLLLFPSRQPLHKLLTGLQISKLQRSTNCWLPQAVTAWVAGVLRTLILASNYVAELEILEKNVHTLHNINGISCSDRDTCTALLAV
jgi:hypothetical protein